VYAAEAEGGCFWVGGAGVFAWSE
jgi:hypothetical protein